MHNWDKMGIHMAFVNSRSPKINSKELARAAIWGRSSPVALLRLFLPRGSPVHTNTALLHKESGHTAQVAVELLTAVCSVYFYTYCNLGSNRTVYNSFPLCPACSMTLHV